MLSTLSSESLFLLRVSMFPVTPSRKRHSSPGSREHFGPLSIALDINALPSASTRNTFTMINSFLQENHLSMSNEFLLLLERRRPRQSNGHNSNGSIDSVLMFNGKSIGIAGEFMERSLEGYCPAPSPLLFLHLSINSAAISDLNALPVL